MIPIAFESHDTRMTMFTCENCIDVQHLNLEVHKKNYAGVITGKLEYESILEADICPDCLSKLGKDCA